MGDHSGGFRPRSDNRPAKHSAEKESALLFFSFHASVMSEKAPPLDLGTPNHYALQTGQVEKVVEFYERVLGFKKAERPFDGMFGGAWLRHEKVDIMVHVIHNEFWSKIKERNPTVKRFQDLEPRKPLDWKGRPTDLRLAGEDHISFPIKDFEKTLKTLDKHGITYHADKRGKQGWFQDPDGRTIE